MKLADSVQNRTEVSRYGVIKAAMMPALSRTGATSGGARLTIRTARSLAEIDALEAAWTALETQAGTPILFQSFGWCRHVVVTLQGVTSCGAIEPFILSAWRGSQVVAIWPLQLTAESGARVLTDLSSPFGQYADIIIAQDRIVAPDQVTATGVDATLTGDDELLCGWMIEQARLISGADALVLRKVRADTPIGRVMAQCAHALQARQWAPFVSMAGFATFEDFHNSTKPKTRKNVRNATHRLEKLGKVTHRVERRSDRMDAALAHCFDLRSTWLESKGLTSTAFAHPAFVKLVQGLANPATHTVDVLSMMLMLDEQPISIHYGFVHNRRYYAYMAARNPDYDACSPGKVHLEHVMAACFAHGAMAVDLLGPEMPYKLVWATEGVETEDYGLTWSVRGWLAIDVWRRRLRPLGRATFLALPDRLRQVLASRLWRPVRAAP